MLMLIWARIQMHWIIIKKRLIILKKTRPIQPNALFMAAYFADRVMKNQKEAIELYKELKRKISQRQKARKQIITWPNWEFIMQKIN